METKRIESMAFLREYFRIPNSVKTTWCIVEEQSANNSELRLGMIINNSNLYLDVARRCFYTAGCCAGVVRKIYPAHKVTSVNNNMFCSTGCTLELPKHYIADIYYPAVYQEALLRDELF